MLPQIWLRFVKTPKYILCAARPEMTCLRKFCRLNGKVFREATHFVLLEKDERISLSTNNFCANVSPDL